MILVTVGTHYYNFNRLIEPVDLMCAQLDEEVIIQKGSCTYIPQHAKFFDFVTGEELEELAAQARILICHAGAGTIIMALKLQKPLIVVPRLKRYQEVLDDHQLQLTKALETSGRAIAVNEPTVDSLRQAIPRAVQISGAGGSERPKLVNALKEQLREWENQQPSFVHRLFRLGMS